MTRVHCLFMCILNAKNYNEFTKCGWECNKSQDNLLIIFPDLYMLRQNYSNNQEKPKLKKKAGFYRKKITGKAQINNSNTSQKSRENNAIKE